MRKIFLLTTLLMMIFSATVFAAEEAENTETAEPTDEPYIYTSEDFKYSIACPIKPLAVVQNPWEEPEKRGEMLVFANEGFDVQFAYIIQVNAWDPADKKVPDFNKGSLKAIGDYLISLKKDGGFGEATLVNLTKENKGVFAVTAESFEVTNKETGEVEGEFVADKQFIYTFFRTPEGRCISIQLVSANLDKPYVDTYRYGVASFQDNSKGDKKDKKDKKNKKDKKKDKKDKKDKK